MCLPVKKSRVFTSDLLDGRGVLITTHEINDIEYIVDKAVLLNEGRVVKEFYPEQVREEEGKSIVDVMRRYTYHEESHQFNAL